MLKTLIKIVLLFTTVTFNSLANTSSLKDVTKAWTFRNDVISAFPMAIRNIKDLRENYLVFKVFSTSDKFNKEVRLEVFYTGDDAEYYPQFYILTNASENTSWASSSRGKAYYLPKLSSPDREFGDVPPELDPFLITIEDLKSYILEEFLTPQITIKK